MRDWFAGRRCPLAVASSHEPVRKQIPHLGSQFFTSQFDSAAVSDEWAGHATRLLAAGGWLLRPRWRHCGRQSSNMPHPQFPLAPSPQHRAGLPRSPVEKFFKEGRRHFSRAPFAENTTNIARSERQILRRPRQILATSPRIPRRRVQIFVAENLSQSHKIVAAVSQETGEQRCAVEGADES